jgi:predicted phosphodiesterase
MRRRLFLQSVSVAGALPLAGRAAPAAAPAVNAPLLASPPVVQHLDAHGFTVSIRVHRLATARVEWGAAPDRLDHIAQAARHGLVSADDQALLLPVRFPAPQPPGSTVHYRVVATPLAYASAYQLTRGEEEATAPRALRLPDPDARSFRVAVVNDTHENAATLDALSRRLQELDPELLIWNGDTCNDFDAKDSPAAILLDPGAAADSPHGGGWASTRPLLFTCGNHDVRGVRAREISRLLAAGPVPDLPWNFALRRGPLALLGLDTGEDKPDRHPVFAGTAAYEPYRARQAAWLEEAVRAPEIANAPFKLAFCHIPLRGRPGDNPGTTLEGYAGFSGFGRELWMPTLRRAGVAAVVSGHTHRWRVDNPTPEDPVAQWVGGGPRPEGATLIVLEATADRLHLRIEDLAGQTLAERELRAGA